MNRLVAFTSGALLLFSAGIARADDQRDIDACVGLSEGAACTSAGGKQGECDADAVGTLRCDADDEESEGVGGGGTGTGTDDGGDVPGRACAVGDSAGSDQPSALLAILGLALIAAGLARRSRRRVGPQPRSKIGDDSRHAFRGPDLRR